MEPNKKKKIEDQIESEQKAISYDMKEFTIELYVKKYLYETNREKYSNSFLVVKNKRNNLAHGNVSFSECGSNYLVSDLEKFKSDILDGMQEVVTQAKEYISNKEYKHKTS